MVFSKGAEQGSCVERVMQSRKQEEKPAAKSGRDGNILWEGFCTFPWTLAPLPSFPVLHNPSASHPWSSARSSAQDWVMFGWPGNQRAELSPHSAEWPLTRPGSPRNTALSTTLGTGKVKLQIHGKHWLETSRKTSLACDCPQKGRMTQIPGLLGTLAAN